MTQSQCDAKTVHVKQSVHMRFNCARKGKQRNETSLQAAGRLAHCCPVKVKLPLMKRTNEVCRVKTLSAVDLLDVVDAAEGR